MSDRVKDVLVRALKTFWQAALAYVFADVSVLQGALSDWNVGKRVLVTIGIGAAAAGLSAVYNGVIKTWLIKE